jgi:hypothetical protein
VVEGGAVDASAPLLDPSLVGIDVEALSTRELTEALQVASLSLGGNSAAKRARLAEYIASCNPN